MPTSPDVTLKRPFGFVRYPEGGAIDRRAPRGHHRYQGKSGVLSCELEALSPMLVMDSEKRAGSSRSQTGRFMQNQRGEYVIPGTSLKGLVRSVFEVLVPSCVPITRAGGMVKEACKACSRREALCPACRIFGFLERGTVHRGQVNVGEARAVETPRAEAPLQLIPLFGPKPRSKHYRFGPSDDGPTGQPRGRKFYYHQAEVQTATGNDKERGPWVEPLAAGSTFRFEVTFENLSEAELGGLVAALTLADEAATRAGERVQVRHKLGYGKPAGLGSVHIRLREAALQPSPEARYRSFAPEVKRLSGAELSAWVDERRRPLFDDPTPPVQDLIDVLRYPPPSDVEYTYYLHGRSY